MLSERFHIPSPSVITEEWTAEDVLDAHLLLEYLAAEREKAEKS